MDVSDAVARLTGAERLQFADLIAECVGRENEIRGNRDRADRALTQMADTLVQLHGDIARLRDRVALLCVKVVVPTGPVQ